MTSLIFNRTLNDNLKYPKTQFFVSFSSISPIPLSFFLSACMYDSVYVAYDTPIIYPHHFWRIIFERPFLLFGQYEKESDIAINNCSTVEITIAISPDLLPHYRARMDKFNCLFLCFIEMAPVKMFHENSRRKF